MMKHIFVTFSIILCIKAGAQSVVTFDTLYQTNENGLFYEVREVQYATGESSTTKTLAGDTSAIFGTYYRAFLAEGNRMATEANVARKFDKEISGIIDRNTAVLLSTGTDPLDTITANFAAEILQSGWNIQDDTTFLDIAFSVNNAGQLRYEITGFPTRQATLIGGSMRLNNYKATGKKMDLFKMPGGNWTSIDDAVKIKLPGNVSSRSAAPPPPKTPAKSGVLLEYYTDSSGKTTFFAGDAVKLKKSGLKYVVIVGGKTFEITEKKK